MTRTKHIELNLLTILFLNIYGHSPQIDGISAQKKQNRTYTANCGHAIDAISFTFFPFELRHTICSDFNQIVVYFFGAYSVFSLSFTRVF